MNKRQSRMFAIACTGIAALVFLVLTVDSHRQFGRLTNAENITPAVIAGQDVWHENNCINCHTLFGEGAYYAPDLTKITQLRGEQYLHAYMRDPARFYDEQVHRRLMPKQNLSDEDITNLIAFLDWVSKVDNQGWPPRPILVTGASIPGTDLTTRQQAHPAQGESPGLPPGARPVSGGEDPVEHAHAAPPDEAVVEGLVRAVGGRRVAPLQAVTDDVDDAAEHSSVVHSGDAMREREVGRQAPHLGGREQERRSGHGGTSTTPRITPRRVAPSN